MRVLVFHGYLLRGTGSNVYNAELAGALLRLGHELHLLCQDRHADELPWVDAVGDWDAGRLSVRVLRQPVRCTVYRPAIGRLLPVYVVDRYESFEARAFPELSDEELERYLAANVSAVAEVAARSRAESALANHEVMGPVILARALGSETPYAVKSHGSALEYTVRPHPRRFVPLAREGLAAARCVLVGSGHTARSLWEVIDDPSLPAKTRLGPPGVDTRAFRPRPAAEAAGEVRALARRLGATSAARWGGDEAAAVEALSALDPEREPVVGYVGKLIVSKGVDLLLAAWPLVLAQVPQARLCVVGFGTFRPGLDRLLSALEEGDLAGARDVAARGRELEGGPPGELSLLASFLDRLEGDRRAQYVASARRAAGRVHFTGRLEHSDLPSVLPAFSAQVVPSTFPESFGMVAVEAAACGVLPVSAAHSGLAEVSAALRTALDPPLRPLLSFAVGPGAVEDIAARLTAWLALDSGDRGRASDALARVARERYGWERVAEGVLAAAAGRLSELPEPALTTSADGLPSR